MNKENQSKEVSGTITEIQRQIGKAICNDETGNVKDVTIRIGQAQELPEIIPNQVDIKGDINAPGAWVEQRAGTFDEKTAHIIANYEERTIILQLDELNPYSTTITGALELDPEFVRFGINSREYVSNFDMADFIKLNRSFFADPTQAMKLVSQLRQFQAKIERDIQEADDKRGNARLLRAQTVEHNLPEHFTLNIPVFRNQPPQTLDVEVNVKASDLTMTLISPEAADFIHNTTREIITAQLSRIAEACPGLVIIEQ